MKSLKPLVGSLRLSVLVAGLLAVSAQAETLVKYDFGTSAHSKTLGPAVVRSDVQATDVSRSDRLSNATDLNSGLSNGNIFIRALATSRGKRLLRTNEDAAVLHHTYFEFTVRPLVGSLAFTKFTASVGGNVQGESAVEVEPFTLTYFVRSSLDNYTTTLGTALVEIPAGGRMVTVPLRVPLTGAAFKGVNDPVTFRLYAYIATETAHYNQVARMDDVVIEGALIR